MEKQLKRLSIDSVWKLPFPDDESSDAQEASYMHQDGEFDDVQLRIAGESKHDMLGCNYTRIAKHVSIAYTGELYESSALSRFRHKSLTRLEAALSDWYGTPVLTGISCGQLHSTLLPLLARGMFDSKNRQTSPIIAIDQRSHRTMQDHVGNMLGQGAEVYLVPHNHVELIEPLCTENPEREVWYIADSVWSMGGGARTRTLTRMLSEYPNLFLYLDDAHGIGVMGEEGQGYAHEYIPRTLWRGITIGTLSKGFGSYAAFCAFGNPMYETTALMRGTAYCFQHGLPIPIADHALATLALHRSEPGKRVRAAMDARTKRIDAALGLNAHWRRVPLRRLIIGSKVVADEVGEALWKANIWVNVNFYPTVPRGLEGVRFALHAELPLEVIDQAAAITLQILAKHKIEPKYEEAEVA